MKKMLCILIALNLAAQLFSQERQDSSITIAAAVKTAYLPIESADTIGRNRLGAGIGVADAIKTFSGIQIKDYGGVGGIKTVNVRSLGSEHIGVFIDGLQVGNAQNMQIDLGRFSTDNLEAICLYNGNRNTRLQTAREYASGASVYLITASPSFVAEKNMNINARLSGGSFCTWNPYLNIERKVDRKNSLRFNIDYLHTDGSYKFRKFDSTMVRKNSDVNRFRAEGDFFHKGNTNWNIKTYWYESQRGLPGPVVRRINSTVADRQTDRNIFIQGRWAFPMPQIGSWVSEGALAAKYSYDYTRYATNPFKDPSAMPVDNNYHQHNAYGSYSHLLSKGNLSLGLAEDFEYTYLKANLPDFAMPSRYSSWTALSFNAHWQTLSLSANVLYNFIADRVGHSQGGFAQKSGNHNFITPSFSLRYSPSPEWTFTGLAKRSCRMPSFNDLFYTVVGNSSLMPEKALQTSLNAERHDNISGSLKSDVKVEGYFNSVSDKIIAVPTSNQFRWTMFNIGKVRIIGTDVSWRLSKSGLASWSLLAKYSFQRAMDFSQGNSITWKGQIPYIPRHSGSFSGDIGFRGWKMEATLILTGKRWSSSANTDDFMIGEWHTLDMRISKSLKNISFWLNINNILNQQYEIVRSYPMPGINFMAGIGYSF